MAFPLIDRSPVLLDTGRFAFAANGVALALLDGRNTVNRVTDADIQEQDGLRILCAVQGNPHILEL